MRYRAFIGITALAGVMLTAACGGDDKVVAEPRVEGSRAVSYESVAEIARDSSLAVIASPVPGSASFEPIEELVKLNPDVPPAGFDLVELAVTETVAGDAASDTITVRTLAGTGDFEGWREGATYLLLLRPFEWEPGRPTGEWTVTGGFAGVFGVDGDTATHLDQYDRDLPEGPPIPATQSVSDLRATITSSVTG